ncbi:AMP-binding protein [Ottowia thiooxydans]|uniref:AMP-binding protein n=1 Tax=Ottowia thiooxydans TaxID=219182 RepID=UPI0004010DAF|nr:AMP-binding protein [Ottowia thiooxydans]
MTLDLRRWALEDPERLAVRVGTVSTTYGELEAQANRVARVLREYGIERGDHVAALMGNGASVFAVVWGAYRVGAYITPVPSTASVEDAAYIVRDCGARAVIADACLGDGLKALPSMADQCAVWLALSGEIPGFISLDPLLAKAPDTPVDNESSGALMMYTSGTTGHPKGVWRALSPTVSACPPFAQDLIAMFDVSENSRYLSTAPLYHAAPLRFGLAFLAAGGSVFVMPRFEASKALELLQNEQITHSQWVPTMFQRLLDLDERQRAQFKAPHHRLALHSAAPCPVPVKRAMIEWWGPILEEYYSGSEGVGLTAITSEEWLARPGSVGRARKGTLHILDEAENELGAGETGRVFFSGIAPFAYHGAPEKTALRTSRQGWQTFGDLGYADADGYLFLTDRLDDMIISGGVNIYPQELEAALLEMPEIAEVAVVGAPDHEFGERPVAFVVPRQSHVDPIVLAEAIGAFALQRLGRIKRPRDIRIVEALPYSPQGKLLRRELRRQLAS